MDTNSDDIDDHDDGDGDSDNKQNKNNDDKLEVINGELVMMHDKNEDYMAIQELGIHDRDKYILNPPLFWSGSSTESDTDKSVIELVRKSFIHLNNILR